MALRLTRRLTGRADVDGVGPDDVAEHVVRHQRAISVEERGHERGLALDRAGAHDARSRRFGPTISYIQDMPLMRARIRRC